jgi:hypothetical protein
MEGGINSPFIRLLLAYNSMRRNAAFFEGFKSSVADSLSTSRPEDPLDGDLGQGFTNSET